ncbi:hypothetical protein G6686_02145 [Polynucleobacter paneuropaeus]|nr:hypothetical protein G6686_02145 [Polynucleobacter paneuropaeus]
MSEARIQGGMCEIFEVYQPQTLSQSELENDGPYLVYGANGVIGKHTSFNHEESQVLITCRGATCGTINISAPFSWINGNAMVIKPREKNIDLRFLKYYLESGIDIKKVITGAAQPQITRQSLSFLKVDLPPLVEQQHIALILDKADSIKQMREMTIEKLDELVQSIFIEMFGDPKFNPLKWEYKKLSELVTKLGDGLHGTPKYNDDGEYYFINGNNLHNGVIKTNSTTKKVDFDEFIKHKKELNSSTMIVSINGTLGKVAFYNDEKIILGKSACYFNVKESLINKTYLFHLLESQYFMDYALNMATGSTIKNVSLKSMRNFPIPLPPIDLQEKFCNRMNRIATIKLKINEALSKQTKLFNSLQNQAFSGQL